LFPIALIASAVGLVIGIVALARQQQSRATNRGQAIAGVVCNALALALAITFSVQLGTWAARNSAVFTRFDNCLIKSGNRAEVSQCIARFASDVRPQTARMASQHSARRILVLSHSGLSPLRCAE
jgi:hypothetical protein